ASHTRNRRTSPPDSSCLPGTRKIVLEKITAWVEDATQHVLWLCGPVGCGKSAIAQTVAEELDRQARLAASFFFFRGSPIRSRMSNFVVTLASQMAIAIPSTKEYVDAALASQAGGIQGSSVSMQVQRLVLRP
ncbi:hypothetical protein FA13DRAFT_1604364, partial [Coprinellus micaceus]